MTALPVPLTGQDVTPRPAPMICPNHHSQPPAPLTERHFHGECGCHETFGPPATLADHESEFGYERGTP